MTGGPESGGAVDRGGNLGFETEEHRELRRTIRDLVAISTLPAVWSGVGAARIAESLADLLMSSLELEMIYIRGPGARADAPLEVGRRRGRPITSSRVHELGRALAPWLEIETAASARGIVNPVGSGTIYPAVVRFGTGATSGVLFAGSQRRGFPSERDRLVLGVGVNHMVVMQQRDRAEEALRESEGRFRRLADSAPVMIWMSEPDGSVSFESESWYRFTGQQPGEALGEGWLDAVHPADRAAIRQRWRDANQATAETREEYRLRRADGEYRWVLDAASPRRGEHGEFLGYIGSVIDITDRKRAEEMLAESERRYQMVTQSIPQILWSTDAAGKPDFFNQRFYEYTGLPPGSMPEDSLLHPDDLARTAAAWKKAVKSRRPLEVEYRMRRHDGGYEWFLAQGAPLVDADGKVVRWFGSCTNVDAQRRARQRL